MQEIELKFQVPRDRREAVDAAVANGERGARMRLQAAYFDTAGRALAAAGMALRIRREGRRWVQTLKGAGDDGLTRAEHNVPLPAGGDPHGVADPARHAGSPIGERLAKLLAEHPSQPLQCLFRTDIRRRSRRLSTRQGTVELAFDEGVIVAGERRLAVCELEIELVDGSALAVVATARRWVRRHGLSLDTRSKAERGDLLSRAETMAPPREARAVHLDKHMTPEQGLRCVLLSCLDQVSVNASQVAAIDHDAEHAHQLRIGLRRLRTALRLFDDSLLQQPLLAEMADSAAALSRSLGAARDRSAIEQSMEEELGAAMAAAGMHFKPPTPMLSDDAVEPSALVRSRAFQTLLLDLFEATQTPAIACEDDKLDLRAHAAKRLARWHRKAAAGAKRFATLDDASRHRLRRRVKRLRYGVEFAGDLFGRKPVRRCVKRLRDLQDRLGRIVDVTVALDSFRRSGDDDPHALFAVGWLAARKNALIEDAAKEMGRFGGVERFWKA
jgi:triphosphatase